jgi:hypothetical protein
MNIFLLNMHSIFFVILFMMNVLLLLYCIVNDSLIYSYLVPLLCICSIVDMIFFCNQVLFWRVQYPVWFGQRISEIMFVCTWRTLPVSVWWFAHVSGMLMIGLAQESPFLPKRLYSVHFHLQVIMMCNMCLSFKIVISLPDFHSGNCDGHHII